MQVDVLLPVKPLTRAKTRLLGAADAGAGSPAAHTRLVLALVRDTVAAATAATAVRRVVVICSDHRVRAALVADQVVVLPDEPATGLNHALRYGAAQLRAMDSAAPIAALPADLPALHPAELTRAVQAGLTATRSGRRAFCADRTGTGTTLLLAPPGMALDPRFGPGSAAAHQAAGALALHGHWPGLRCDVDTPADLDAARRLGLGQYTEATFPASRSATPD